MTTVMQLTPAEIKHVAGVFEKLSKNVCPSCDRAVTRQVQRGHSVYAEPCGHRLYQGKIGAFAPQPGEMAAAESDPGGTEALRFGKGGRRE